MSKEEKLEFNETTPVLSDLLKKGSKRIIHNTTKLQADDADTCGRWAALRIRQGNKPMDQFVSDIKGSGMTPDETVTLLTHNIIHK